MQKRTRNLIIGILLGLVLMGATGLAVYHYWAVPRFEKRTEEAVKRATAEEEADASSLSKKAADLSKQADKKNAGSQSTAKPGTDSVDKLSAASEQTLTKRLKEEQFVGTLLLVRGGQIIYNQGFGYADAATKRLNTVNSLFQIGSTQKSLTAILVAQLIAQGKLHYTDNINQYYSEIPAGYHITIRQMLDMRSGLSLDVKTPTTVMTDAQVIARAIANMHYSAANQGKQVYQAVNYVILAGVVEKLTGMSYEQAIKTKLFAPLNIMDSQAGFMWDFADQNNHTISYVSGPQFDTYDKIAVETTADMHGELGTGNIYTTPYTLYQLQRAIIQGKYITTEQLAQLRNSRNGEYGGGLYNYGSYVYSHGVKDWQELIMTIGSDGNDAVIFMSNRAYDYDNARPRSQWYWNFLENAQVQQ